MIEFLSTVIPPAFTILPLVQKKLEFIAILILTIMSLDMLEIQFRMNFGFLTKKLVEIHSLGLFLDWSLTIIMIRMTH